MIRKKEIDGKTYQSVSDTLKSLGQKTMDPSSFRDKPNVIQVDNEYWITFDEPTFDDILKGVLGVPKHGK